MLSVVEIVFVIGLLRFWQETGATDAVEKLMASNLRPIGGRHVAGGTCRAPLRRDIGQL
jgi:hypothetical protein